MRYLIYQDGQQVNAIEATEAFVTAYCAAHGYTWEESPLPETPAPDPTPTLTTEERLDALEAENTLLQAQIAAQSDQMDFYEECIAEMAMVVYA